MDLFDLLNYIFIDIDICVPYIVCTSIFRKTNAHTTKKDEDAVAKNKTDINEPKDRRLKENLNDSGILTSSTPAVTTPLTSKKPTNNYDWLRPPKPQLINANAQKPSNAVLESSKDSTNLTSKTMMVNKNISSLSSSSSNSSSPPNR